MAGQYVAYTFFKVDPAWRRLPIDERAAGKDAFAEVVEDFAGRMTSLRAYESGQKAIQTIDATLEQSATKVGSIS